VNIVNRKKPDEKKEEKKEEKKTRPAIMASATTTTPSTPSDDRKTKPQATPAGYYKIRGQIEDEMKKGGNKNKKTRILKEIIKRENLPIKVSKGGRKGNKSTEQLYTEIVKYYEQKREFEKLNNILRVDFNSIADISKLINTPKKKPPDLPPELEEEGVNSPNLDITTPLSSSSKSSSRTRSRITPPTIRKDGLFTELSPRTRNKKLVKAVQDMDTENMDPEGKLLREQIIMINQDLDDLEMKNIITIEGKKFFRLNTPYKGKTDIPIENLKDVQEILTRNYDNAIKEWSERKKLNFEDSDSDSDNFPEITGRLRQREQAQDATINQLSAGVNRIYKGKGLSTTEIGNMMDGVKGFIGVYPANFLKMLPKNLPKKFGFVMNLDKANKSGSHWVAVWVDTEQDLSVEYYDSFAREPSKDFLKQIKKLIDRLNINVYLKFKINRIQEQKTSTANCGWFAMKFIIDRKNGIPFKESTNYNDSTKGEKDIEEFKNKFSYI
jgi:hypothetical protein